MIFRLSVRIDFRQRLKDPIGTRLVVRAGHDDFETGGGHRIEYSGVVDGDDDAADGCLPGAQRHLDDHRQTANIGQRLARKPCGGHARRDQYEHAV